MREIFVIYNKNTGFVDGGAGRIGRTNIGKTGTMIARILSESPDRKVIYLPNQKLPDAEKHKIKNSKIVNLTQADKNAIEAAKPKTEFQLLEERVAILEAKI